MVQGSPFPGLYAELKGDEDLFLAAARIFAVLQLLLTNTVERIHKLELTVREGDRLAVDFKGSAGADTNGPPHVIKVEGVCDLSPR